MLSSSFNRRYSSAPSGASIKRWRKVLSLNRRETRASAFRWRLAESSGAKIAGLGFVVELDFLNGRDKLGQYDVFSLLHYDK